MNRLCLYVFTAGTLVGLSELLTRHRDYPLLAAITVPSLFYLVLNGALSVLALLIVNLSPPEFLKEAGSIGRRTTCTSTAGGRRCACLGPA